MAEAVQTTNHDEIRQWIEKRGGRPARVVDTGGNQAANAGILRVDFGERDASLEEIPWDVFFATFEKSKLAFLHQDRTDDGKTSRFFKFIQRD